MAAGVVGSKTGRIWSLILENYKCHPKDSIFYSVVNGETWNVLSKRIIKSELYCRKIGLYSWKGRRMVCKPQHAVSLPKMLHPLTSLLNATSELSLELVCNQ